MLTTRSPRPALLLALICVPIFIGALDLTVVSAVLPHVILDLEIPLQGGLERAAWIVTGYLLAYSVSMTFMGRLSDLYGRRLVYLLALGIFGLGSYLVAVADNWPTQLALRAYYLVASGRPDVSFITLDLLIAARMIQAFGAGSMVPVGMALVGDLYAPGRRARALGLIAAVDTAGWVVGHLYGGILVRFWDWRVIFWLNLPVCLAAFGLIWWALRALPRPAAEGRMDWAGALLITATLSLLNIGLGNDTQQAGLPLAADVSQASEFLLPALLLAGLMLALFLWRQKQAEHPLLDLGLFARRNYLPASLLNLLVGFSLFIAIANVPLFINSLVAATLEQGAWDSGWLLSALTVPMALAALLGGAWSERQGYRRPALGGLALAALGFMLMGGWRAATPYALIAAELAVCGIGLGLTMAPGAAAVVNAAPPDQRGTSSALVIIFRLIGMTVGVSSITSYDLTRARTLSQTLLSATPGLEETVRVGILVTERVLSESFAIAGIIVLLAVVPALFLQDPKKEVENE